MHSEVDIFEAVGGFGRYQLMQCVILSLASFFGTDLLYNNFLLYTPDHWCKVDPSPDHANLSLPELRNLTIPWNKATGTFRFVMYSTYIVGDCRSNLCMQNLCALMNVL